ncbi:heat-shock protein Hsp20 [Prauserella marina]|uniref:HSP20 family protein n=1 Tax=Prauserella marina TaxID=530584 RepID=A0A222VM37_9PSEU|nr:Hsp20/alpha crystallin family protein [Prauserella marina]ASR34986.1 heat-shock protein Hsp20 [Prauserella marina]PWV85288.1 HSP20 family protein [Prauserella marina]SDC00495.1 HSP20 family protein [Prauserella marina]
MSLPAVRTSRPMGTWDPFREFDNLYRVFGAARPERDGTWSPAADVTETEEGYSVEVELPGVKKDDIDVDLTGNRLTITGEAKEKEREGTPLRRARRTGRFSYRVALPRNVDSDNIEAALADGVLTVTVPKSASAKPRKITVSGS